MTAQKTTQRYFIAQSALGLSVVTTFELTSVRLRFWDYEENTVLEEKGQTFQKVLGKNT
ncbi:MAG: hypothetical protein JSV04_10970 [Candidatus Heimdallarchaeota archaeon]|nr:MAG: hypothetical protein JSV04_10970 [Candidatus Heimdallarchaeota archaeon]